MSSGKKHLKGKNSNRHQKIHPTIEKIFDEVLSEKFNEVNEKYLIPTKEIYDKLNEEYKGKMDDFWEVQQLPQNGNIKYYSVLKISKTLA
jgi:hypothetical protein